MRYHGKSGVRRGSRWAVLLSLGLFRLFGGTALAEQQSVDKLLSTADDVLKQMTEITGLPIKGPLKKQVVGRAEVEKYLTENLHEEMTPDEIHAQESVVRAFGLVPPDFNLERFLIAFYTEQLAGFYDPKRKTMFIADWITDEMQGLTLSHELTHALQDQNWDLEGYLRGAHDDDDATSARQAVVEGYATAAMMQQTLGGADLGQLPSITPLIEQMIPQQFDEYPTFSKAPFFFKMVALFPYLHGLEFIQTGLQQGGWKGLNQVFENPPINTQQIFEPQTYYQRQTFPKLALPHPPALEHVAGLRFVYENTMGELGYYSVLGQLISEDEAKQVGPDWLADRFLLYERSGGEDFVLVARTRWQTQESAQRFFQDYHSILTQKHPEVVADPRSSSDEFIGSANNGNELLVRKGSECIWAEGVPVAQAEAVLAWLYSL